MKYLIAMKNMYEADDVKVNFFKNHFYKNKILFYKNDILLVLWKDNISYDYFCLWNSKFEKKISETRWINVWNEISHIHGSCNVPQWLTFL